MAQFIGVDTLAFVSIDGLYRAMGTPGRDPKAPRFCDACFTGDYPIPLVDHDAGKVSTQLSLLAETDDAIKAAGGSATLLPLDLADGALIDRIGPSILERFGRLDIFVANAA